MKGLWEQFNNPRFNPAEFDGFRKLAGLNSFALTPKQWIEKTRSIGLTSKAGRYGETYAHKADVSQLVCLANLECLNAHLIAEGVAQAERLSRLNKFAISQMRILTGHTVLPPGRMKKIKGGMDAAGNDK